jgi:hypothetical protein
MNPKKPIISASEIGQFHYCSISWYLQRCGYKPKSESIERGYEQHKKLGVTLDHVNKSLKKSKIIALLGFILLFLSLLFFLLEVVS